MKDASRCGVIRKGERGVQGVGKRGVPREGERLRADGRVSSYKQKSVQALVVSIVVRWPATKTSPSLISLLLLVGGL